MNHIIFWNCRGARKKATGDYLKHIVNDHEVHFVGLLETKATDLTRMDVDRLIGKHWDFAHQPANGKAGGILALWRCDLVSFSVLSLNEQCIIGCLTDQSCTQWGIALVYANKDYHRRRLLWDQITHHRLAATPWIVGGDFNCILSQADKKGGKIFNYSAGVAEMDEFMRLNDLHEVGFNGPKYTWCNNKDGTSKIWVRLDRILLNSCAFDLAPLARVKHLVRLASDHCPLLLDLCVPQQTKGNRWFKFEDTWLSYPMAWKIVKTEWEKQRSGSDAEVLNRKCIRTLKALFYWSKHKLKELGETKASLEAAMAKLQEVECSVVGLSNEQQLELRSKALELNSTLARITSWWRQRAKVRWINEGDANSHFFHSVASGRRRTNRITSLKINGQRTEDSSEIVTDFIRFFEAKWKAADVDLSDGPSFTNCVKIMHNEAERLCLEVSVEEMWRAVQEMGMNRAPGLDGITSSFIKSFWSIVHKDFFTAILHFFRGSDMPTNWKETVVVLIPKVANADSPASFRPISLCQSVYKIVAKILVNRLKGLLPTLISEEQGAFVPQRSISSHCLLAQELINKFKHSTSKVGFMALKIDMEQAYDRMDWKALQYVMDNLHFPPQFTDWVMKCVTKPRFSLLINGALSRWIDAECGFRQGCPLSPYLFILCSQLLSMTLHQKGTNLGVAIANGGTSVSHLLYADDILIASQATAVAAKEIKEITNCYCKWTGQRINMIKTSILFSKTVKPHIANRISRTLGYRKVKEFKYLGIKLATRALRCSDFTNLIQRAKAKTNAWGNRHLSLAGRATLIRTSLLPAPMYAVTHTVLPKRIIEDIQKMGRQFLWQQHAGKTGLHYIAWGQLCQPLGSGGLGFHATEYWKGPLRARLAWNFLQQPDTMLHKCLLEKYGNRLWQNTLKRGDSATWAVLLDGANSLRKCIRWKIGSGTEINLLGHCWLLDRPLNRWPTFVSNACTENMQVAELLSGNGNWNMEALQNFFGTELIKVITSTATRTEQNDTAELCKQCSGMTITSLAYNANFLDSDENFGWLRKIQLQPREHIFWWRIYKGAVPTNVWLHRRGLSETINCPWGCIECEDITHVTVRCCSVRSILSFLNLWGFHTPQFQSLNDIVMAIKKCTKLNITPMRLYCSAVYQGWRARNARKHGRPHGTPALMAAYILGSLNKNPTFPLPEQWNTTQPCRLSNTILWCPPPPGWLKANVDGSLTQSNQAGIAAIIRNDRGELVVAAGHNFLHWDSAQVEMEAILFLDKIFEPWMYELSGIIIEGDNINIINQLKASMHGTYWKAHPPLSFNIAFLRRFHQVIFHHIPREVNRAAHLGASIASHLDFVWKDKNDVNLDFFDLLHEDLHRFRNN